MSESGITAAKSSGRRGVAAKRAPDDIDRRLINALQGEFPLTETPFADIGAVLVVLPAFAHCTLEVWAP